MGSLKAIAAVAENGVIGCGEKIPWHISDEFRHFKSTTLGGVIVFGRRTWESIGGRPLPNRENVVITSRPEGIDGAKTFPSVSAMLSAYASDTRDIWICGGAKLYAETVAMCDELFISRIKMSPDGDVYFPEIPAKFSNVEKIAEHSQFDVFKYSCKK